jgi:hypothetical protein
MVIRKRRERMRVRPLTKIAIATTLTVLVGVATAVPASAIIIGPGSGAPIYNANSGLCLGVVASTGKVGQYNCTGDPDQLWSLVPAGNGADYIENDDSDCLYATSLNNKTQVYASQDQCSQTGNFVTWIYLGAPSPINANANGGCVIGINAGSKSSGAQAVIWQATGALNQFWNWSAPQL